MAKSRNKIFMMALLCCFLVNTVLVKDLFSFTGDEVFSAAINRQSTLLYCTSMSFLVMKIFKTVMAEQLENTSNSQVPVSKENKKENNKSSQSGAALLQGFNKLSDSAGAFKQLGTPWLTAENAVPMADQPAGTEYLFGVYLIIMASMLVFFMLARGAIDANISITLNRTV